LYRFDYDIAVGESGQTAKEAARREMASATERTPERTPSYTDEYTFAIWCKTGDHSVAWKTAAALATARMLGRVWVWAQDIDDLQSGDHIALNFGVVYYYQHAIVSSIDGSCYFHFYRAA